MESLAMLAFHSLNYHANFIMSVLKISAPAIAQELRNLADGMDPPRAA